MESLINLNTAILADSHRAVSYTHLDVYKRQILGSGYDLELFVQIGGGAYICGEETALIESLEGNRGNPRLKPPFPAVKGLWQNPTVVNNVETISAVPWIINNSGADYAGIGIGRSTGTKLISASGNIKNQGVYEIELGLSVFELSLIHI